jgi:uncharacterized protein YndB with AHSA1/START domain
METTAETTTVERAIAIAASPATVWEFLVDPEKAVRWMGETASFDARPGGEYRVGVIPGHTASGEFVELDPPHRLVFSWGWEGDGAEVAPGSTTIEIELAASAEGTTLRLRHSGLPSPASGESHAHGWEHYVSRLATVAAGGDPGADPWLTGEMS